jgi:hypothetical protein
VPGSFYEEADAMGIVESHISSVLELEHDESLTILEHYSDVRNRLVDRLSRLPPGRFTAQHLRGVLAQVQAAIDTINSKLQGNMADGAYDAALAGVEDLVDEVKAFDQEFLGAVTPINLNAAVMATDTKNFLVTKYKTNLDAYGKGLQAQITNGLFAASVGEVNHEEVVGRISQFFVAEEWKLRRIVRTELHNIYNMGKIRGMQHLSGDIEDLKKTLMHPMDQRTGKDSIYAAQLGLVADIDEPFEYEWRGKLRVFMAPPDRPNDRAILVPYREEWGAARGPGFLPGRFPSVDAYPLDVPPGEQ